MTAPDLILDCARTGDGHYRLIAVAPAERLLLAVTYHVDQPDLYAYSSLVGHALAWFPERPAVQIDAGVSGAVRRHLSSVQSIRLLVTHPGLTGYRGVVGTWHHRLNAMEQDSHYTGTDWAVGPAVGRGMLWAPQPDGPPDLVPVARPEIGEDRRIELEPRETPDA